MEELLLEYMENMKTLMYVKIEGIIRQSIIAALKRTGLKTGKIPNGLDVEVREEGDNLVCEVSGYSYMFNLNEGVDAQPMVWLKGKTIPFKKVGDKLIVTSDEPDFFRRVGEKTFDKPSKYNPLGQFWHTGIEDHKFIEKGIVDSEVEIAELMKEFADIFRS